jgi:hypothetical protein
VTRGVARLAAAALAVLTAAACGGTGAAEPGPSEAGSATPAVLLSAEVVQSRQDQVALVVRVGLTNEGADDVSVRQVQLVAPPFSLDPVDRSDRSALAAGRKVDVRVPYGVPDCSAEPTAVEDPHVTLVLDDPARTEVVVPVDGDVLDGLLRRLCGEQRLAELADVGFGDDWTREGDGVVGTLEMRRDAGVTERPELVLVDTAPTVIFALVPLQGSPPALATLPADEDVVSVPVRVGSPRCDPHALLESKKTYTFAAWVSVDGGEPLWLPVEAQETSREVMGGLLAELCNLS